jgi:hypothetical protein
MLNRNLDIEVHDLTRRVGLHVCSVVSIFTALYFEPKRAASGTPSTWEVRSPLMLFVTAPLQAAREAAPGPGGGRAPPRRPGGPRAVVIRPYDVTVAASRVLSEKCILRRYKEGSGLDLRRLG